MRSGRRRGRRVALQICKGPDQGLRPAARELTSGQICGNGQDWGRAVVFTKGVRFTIAAAQGSVGRFYAPSGARVGAWEWPRWGLKRRRKKGKSGKMARGGRFCYGVLTGARSTPGLGWSIFRIRECPRRLVREGVKKVANPRVGLYGRSCYNVQVFAGSSMGHGTPFLRICILTDPQKRPGEG